MDTTDKDYVSKLVATIARTHFPVLAERGFLTLEPKSSDSLDFVDAAVWSIREALLEAYNCGYADASNEDA